MHILENPTESPQRGIGAGPELKCRCHRRDNLLQSCEITVVQAATPSQFPDPFDRIEFRTVGRKKVQAKVTGDLSPPRLMEFGMVIASVVDDDHQFPARADSVSLQFPIKVPAGHGVKLCPLGRDMTSLPSSGARRRKADALTRRGTQDKPDRPLRAASTCGSASRVLLKVNFIHGPQINVVSARQCAEFLCVACKNESACAIRTRLA